MSPWGYLYAPLKWDMLQILCMYSNPEQVCMVASLNQQIVVKHAMQVPVALRLRFYLVASAVCLSMEIYI